MLSELCSLRLEYDYCQDKKCIAESIYQEVLQLYYQESILRDNIDISKGCISTSLNAFGLIKDIVSLDTLRCILYDTDESNSDYSVCLNVADDVISCISKSKRYDEKSYYPYLLARVSRKLISHCDSERDIYISVLDYVLERSYCFIYGILPLRYSDGKDLHELYNAVSNYAVSVYSDNDVEESLSDLVRLLVVVTEDFI